MTSEEVKAHVAAIRLAPDELAAELRVSERSVRRWMARGVNGHPEAALRAIATCVRFHVPWRAGEVSVSLEDLVSK